MFGSLSRPGEPRLMLGASRHCTLRNSSAIWIAAFGGKIGLNKVEQEALVTP
jgi:hypothetical protein